MSPVSTLCCLGVCCDLLEVGLGVGEEDEVDHKEGSVEHEEGAADQHAARPHTQLETRHVVTRGTRGMPHHTCRFLPCGHLTEPLAGPWS